MKHAPTTILGLHTEVDLAGLALKPQQEAPRPQQSSRSCTPTPTYLEVVAWEPRELLCSVVSCRAIQCGFHLLRFFSLHLHVLISFPGLLPRETARRVPGFHCCSMFSMGQELANGENPGVEIEGTRVLPGNPPAVSKLQAANGSWGAEPPP